MRSSRRGGGGGENGLFPRRKEEAPVIFKKKGNPVSQEKGGPNVVGEKTQIGKKRGQATIGVPKKGEARGKPEGPSGFFGVRFFERQGEEGEGGKERTPIIPKKRKSSKG